MSINLLTIPEVATRLALSRAKVYQILNSGKLKAIKIDRSRRVSNEALENNISGLENNGDSSN